MPKKKSIKKSEEVSKKQTVTSLVGWELDSFPTIYNNEIKKQKSIKKKSSNNEQTKSLKIQNKPNKIEYKKITIKEPDYF